MNKILLICMAFIPNILNATTHGVFDEIDQGVFQPGTKKLYEECGDFLKGKEANQELYSEVCSMLAQKRKEIAQVSDSRHRLMPWINPGRESDAEEFGVARPETGIANTYLVRSENVALINLLTKKFIKYLDESCVDREPFSLKSSREISAPSRVDSIAEINSFIDHSVFDFHIYNELDEEYKALGANDRLGQFRFSDFTNIKGQLVGTSRIYVLIHIERNKPIIKKTKRVFTYR